MQSRRFLVWTFKWTGFRKVEASRWEFANASFLRGQRHLLKGIQRKKAVSTAQQQPFLAAGGVFLEGGKYQGVQDEIEGLRRDKNLLMSEILWLRKRQQYVEQEITTLSNWLQSTEHRQQQMRVFLGRMMSDPSSMPHLSKSLDDSSKKRRLPDGGSSTVQPGYNVSRHTSRSEELQALLQQMEQNQCGSEGVGKTIVTQKNSGVEENLIAQNLFEDRSSDVAFLEELLHVQYQMTSANLEGGMHEALMEDCTARKTFGAVTDSSEAWDYKLDIMVDPSQMGN